MRGIKEITSKDNAIFKLIKSLKVKKNRIREALFVVEGPKQVIEAGSSRYGIRYLVVRRDRLDFFNNDGFFEEIPSTKVEIISMDESLFRQIADTENSQGILAVLSYEMLSGEDLMRQISADSNVLILDRLQDPGNIGTLVRTAEGAGFKGVVLLKGSGDVFSPKAIRAGGGATLRMPVTMLDDAYSLRELSDRFSKRLVVTDVSSGLAYYDVDLSENVFLVMGNEGRGVSKEVLDLADVRINIPTEGLLESLNVATAGAILMMDSLRQNKNRIGRG
ncbi:hypothetical protein HMPREF1635_00440 [Clostridiales bacterium S5-A14a]|nr:hypothetical protein HMPREF1635_00440 [Clostridiales bacterium S5-A14a]